MKIRLDVYDDTATSTSSGCVVKMVRLPRLGERVEGGPMGIFVIADVLHTPFSQNQDAVVTLVPDLSSRLAN